MVYGLPIVSFVSPQAPVFCTLFVWVRPYFSKKLSNFNGLSQQMFVSSSYKIWCSLMGALFLSSYKGIQASSLPCHWISTYSFPGFHVRGKSWRGTLALQSFLLEMKHVTFAYGPLARISNNDSPLMYGTLWKLDEHQVYHRPLV